MVYITLSYVHEPVGLRLTPQVSSPVSVDDNYKLGARDWSADVGMFDGQPQTPLHEMSRGTPWIHPLTTSLSTPSYLTPELHQPRLPRRCFIHHQTPSMAMVLSTVLSQIQKSVLTHKIQSSIIYNIIMKTRRYDQSITLYVTTINRQW